MKTELLKYYNIYGKIEPATACKEVQGIIVEL